MHPLKLPWSLGRWAPLAAAIVGSAALAAPAGAAILSPDRAITATYNASDLLLVGYADGARVDVLRDGAIIAKGENLTDGAGEGGVNSAHPAVTGCWTGFTPQLLPGDVISVAGDTMTIQDITAEKARVENGVLTVHGTAADVANGGAQPAADAFDVVAVLEGDKGAFTDGTGSLSTINSGQHLGGSLAFLGSGSSWTAQFPQATAQDISSALNGAKTIGAMSPIVDELVNGAETTQFEAGAQAGPLNGCTAPFAPNEAKGANHTTINAANVGTDLVINGVSQPDASATSVTLKDSAGRTITAPASGAGTWTATVPAAQLAGLAEGAISVMPSLAVTDGPFHGATVSLLTKDTIAPAAPTASVASGTYSSAQSVALNAAEGTIHYTVDGSEPNASSKAFSGAISVPSSQTIKAVAVDPAGNVSPVSSFDYKIVAPTTTPVVTKPRLPKLRLEALTIAKRISVRSAHRRGISMVIFAPDGAKVVRVRLLRGSKLITRTVRKVSGDGVVHVVLPTTKKGRAKLRRGSYKVQVAVGQNTSNYGVTSTRTIRIR